MSNSVVSRLTDFEEWAAIIEFPKECGRKCKSQLPKKVVLLTQRKECGDEAVMNVGDQW